MIPTFWVRVIVAATLSLSCVGLSPAVARESARTLYDRAVRMEKDFRQIPIQQKNPTSWKRLIQAYRAVYYSHPTSGYCDNALFHVGSLYVEMGDRFEDNLYFRRASSTFRFLIEQYPSSSLVDDAMMEYIRIMRDELGLEEDAEKMHSALLAINPEAVVPSPPQGFESSEPNDRRKAVLENVRHYTGKEYTRIVLDFDREVTFRRNRLSDPDRLYFDFHNTVASKALKESVHPVDDSFLRQIRVGQNTIDRARVVLDLKSIQKYEVFSLYHPFRIVIDVQGEQVAQADKDPVPETSPTPPEMAKANTNGTYSLARQLGLKVRRIMLDPGHGGHDPGAMSGTIREKDITLDVSRRLKTLLEVEYGFEVSMTRETDFFVPLEERTARANTSGADLFVSVHVNSSRNRKARGIETYYLNFATSNEAMEVAARENAIAEKNMAELQRLTTAIAMNSKIEESRDFAKALQANLTTYLGKEYAVNNLGVKQAPFYVLIGAQMPSVLAEISFLSNDKEFRLLQKDSYRQSIARGIALGVKNYIDTLAESRLTQNRSAR